MTTIQKVLRITRPKCCCVAFPAKIPLILSPFFCKTIVCDFMAVDSLKAFFNRVTDAFGITDKNTTLSNWGFHNRCNVMPIIFLYMISVPCKSRWLGLRWNPTHGTFVTLSGHYVVNQWYGAFIWNFWGQTELWVSCATVFDHCLDMNWNLYTNLIIKFFLITFIVLLLCKEFIQWNVFFVIGVLIQKGQECNFTPSQFIASLSCKKLHEIFNKQAF